LHTVLIAEDEFVVAHSLCQTLERSGYRTLVASSERAALSLLADTRPDAAILDLLLGGRRSVTVMEACDQAGIPYCIATGFESWLPPAYRGRPILKKPYSPQEAIDVIAVLLHQRQAAPAAE